MDPKLDRQDRNRGAALWGNLVISVTGYAGRVIATDKETGTIVWDKSLLDQADLELTAAPLALKDAIVIGEPGSETWKDNHGAWQTGGGAFYVTGAYDPAANLTYWGSGNAVPAYDPT